jgi:group I intron endonuclease
MDAGIYKISHAASGRAYVGSAVNIKKRWATHRHALRTGRHHSQKLQRAWSKYGEAEFCLALKGRPKSEATKARMRAAQQRRAAA